MINRLQQWFGNGWMGIVQLLITMFCVFFSLSFHEMAHGFVAYKMGDNTAKSMGRLSINPLAHLDPIGAICLFLFGFGWANPVPIDSRNFKCKNIKTGIVLTALAGPIANLILAFVSMLLLKVIEIITIINSTVYVLVQVIYILLYGLTTMNLGLAVFNLIPIPPLDGSKVLNSFLPARTYFKIMQYERYGFIVLILLINTSLFTGVLNGGVSAIYNLFSYIIGLIPFLG